MRKKDPKLMKAIVCFIDSYYEENLKTPSTRRIAEAVGSNRNSVQRYLIELNERNELVYNGRVIRTQKMEHIDNEMRNAGLIGSVSCGLPTLEEENVQTYIPLPTRIFGNGELYLLTANGDSMIGAGIDDGDIVVIQKTTEAKEGDIIVALLDNETTLKRLIYDKTTRSAYLHPENERYEDILVKSLEIQGIATHVIKSLKNMDIQHL